MTNGHVSPCVRMIVWALNVWCMTCVCNKELYVCMITECIIMKRGLICIQVVCKWLKGKGSCIMCDLYGNGVLCLIILLGHHVYEEYAWLHKTVCECEKAM